MIIVNLKGGLGNQMFQYACAKALSFRQAMSGNENELKLDTSEFEKTTGTDTPRKYELGAFNIKENIASAEEIKKLKYPLGPLSKVAGFTKAKVFRKFHVSFHPSILKKKGDVYLDGFFQDERYFKDIEEVIRSEFALKKPFAKQAKELFEKISRDPYSVSIHVRRGDYVSNKAAREHHGSCDIEYYEDAVIEIAKRMGKPSLYIFSDDIDWAKDNMAFSCPVTFVSAKGISNAEEMMLMSACRHNVIANSTFSWWAAWLNRNEDKIIVAPRRWSNKHNNDWYANIVPKNWLKI